MGSHPYSAMSLGGSIKRQRQSLGLTQSDVARSVGVSRKFIIELEAGKESASLGLTLRVMRKLGFAEPGVNSLPDRGTEIANIFQQTLEARDYEYALRLVGEYSAESLEHGYPLLRAAPSLDDEHYFVALAALTRWIAAKTRTATPRWAVDVRPASEPIYLSEKIYPVGERMKQLIRNETPAELKDMNVWIRERSLARP